MRKSYRVYPQGDYAARRKTLNKWRARWWLLAGTLRGRRMCCQTRVYTHNRDPMYSYGKNY